jgi:hypothetical protein
MKTNREGQRKMMRAILMSMAALGLLLPLWPGAARGQSAVDGFDPGAPGVVVAVAVQTDGKIVVGGSFTQLGGPPRNNIGRLNADGTLTRPSIRGQAPLSNPSRCKPMARLCSAANSRSWADNHATASDGSTLTARST